MENVDACHSIASVLCPRCHRYCPSGYKEGKLTGQQRGCSSCECKDPIEQEMNLTTQHLVPASRYPSFKCPLMTCDTSHCKFGVRKFNGCKTCACAEAPKFTPQVIMPSQQQEKTLSDLDLEEMFEE